MPGTSPASTSFTTAGEPPPTLPVSSAALTNAGGASAARDAADEREQRQGHTGDSAHQRSFSHSWPANTLTLEPWCPQAAQAALAPPSHSRSPPHFAHR